MHELSLCSELLASLGEQAQRHGFARVREVWLEVGMLSGVAPEALEFCFAALARGTMAEGARLVIQQVPAQGWCPGCDASAPMDSAETSCAHCGMPLERLAGGDGLRLKALDVA
ncbi:MAG: hydrogenase maturation nickel metallochaperone HypA [Magnetococcus sp. WYHC-3]